MNNPIARRVAENHPFTLRMTKLRINKAQDAQGFRSLLEDSLGDYVARTAPARDLNDGRRLAAPTTAWIP